METLCSYASERGAEFERAAEAGAAIVAAVSALPLTACKPYECERPASSLHPANPKQMIAISQPTSFARFVVMCHPPEAYYRVLILRREMSRKCQRTHQALQTDGSDMFGTKGLSRSFADERQGVR